ncbi:APC family permease [Klenkia sp. PcliD-1-E]|uniref:APC family permease n=1 Tax=Klenkia sp. PcliD-1-E TaxID=2954492 RepID=UPI0020980F75|nr:APC family permease [Klenkia sp. PcliD-1-E]MCO7221089.1 APC family permease [Klenkia sp. PcliD-1-E]
MSAPSPAPQLKQGAIGFVDALVIGLASTSPAYSLAAVVGAVVALVGVYAPGVFLASFVPMLLIASAFYYLNKADQDCGTTFSWVTRAMGPWVGWMGGWAIAMTGVLVIGSLADVGVRFGLYALQLDGVADNTFAVRTLTVLLILAMTAICVLGTEISAKLQNALIIAQIVALLVFAGIALVAGLRGNGADGGSITPELSWLNPFGAGGAALTGGLLLGVFIYWGWESAVNLTEETSDAESTPGKAAVVSTVVLLVTYLGCTFAILSYFGPAFLADRSGEEETIFYTLATQVMGPWDWVLLLAVSTSAIASTQTTILPASRTGLSMARRHAMPRGLARIHPRFRTPDVSTWTVAAIAIVWYLVVNAISENALFDSLTALSLLIAFYYSLTGIACAVFHRRQLTRSVKDFFLIGVGPVIGSLLLIWLLVESIGDLADPANSYSGVSWFGVGPPLVIGIGIFVVGVVFMLVWRFTDARFWAERTTTVERLQADIAAGRSGAAVEDPAP